jgi:drug/metabolite transporter (DMT)-like permease
MKGSGAGGGFDHAYVVLFVQSLFAAGTHIVAKVVVRTVDPVTLTMTRSLIVCAVMVPLLLARGTFRRIDRRDLGLIFGLAILAVPINQFFYLYGMRFTIASNAALLYATTPLLVLLFSRLFLRESLTRHKIIGVALGFVGVTIVIFERGVSASLDLFFGNIVVFVAVLAWALYTVYGRKLIERYGAIEATSLILVGGSVAFLPFGIISTVEFPFSTLTRDTWLQILYLSVITSILGYLLWYYALGRLEAGKVALFANLQPILTTVLAVILLDQAVTAPFIIGGVIAITGVIVAQFG